MDENGDGKLGRIALKQVRMTRAQADAQRTPAAANPMNRCVPYLDLFGRLSDDEVSRLARVPTSVVAELRKQVEAVNKALVRFVDLIPRLSEEELVRLTGASQKKIRFWRLCQPRGAPAGLARASESGSRPRIVADAPRPSDSSSSMRTPAPTTTTPTAAPKPAPAESSRPHTVPSPTDSQAGVRHHESSAAQSSASMQMANITGDPFPGFEQDFEPTEEEVEDEIEIGLLEEGGEEEASGSDEPEFELEDDDDFF